MEIPDENTDVEVLQFAFGLLHQDGVLRKPSQVTAMVVAACVFQL